MFRLLLLAALFLCPTALPAQPLDTAEPESVGMSASGLARISTTFEAEIEAGRLPGAVVMVARRGRLVYAAALGERDPETGASMPRDAIFRIYSLTKPLTAVAAMILVEEGRMALSDPVSKYLPELDHLSVLTRRRSLWTFWRTPDFRLEPAASEMTVHDLLRHTSGLAYAEIMDRPGLREAYAEAGLYAPEGPPFDARGATAEAQVAALATAPLVSHPGTEFRYSVSYDILGRVIERIAGVPLGDFMAARIFEPLKMTDTGFAVSEADRTRIAEPFAAQHDLLIDVSSAPASASGGAGAVASAGDYLRFVQMLLNGGSLDGVRVIAPATAADIVSDHLGDAFEQPSEPGELMFGVTGYTYGLGVAVREVDTVDGVPGTRGDFGWSGFSGTYFWGDPELEIAAVLMIQNPQDRRRFRFLLRELVYDAVTVP